MSLCMALTAVVLICREKVQQLPCQSQYKMLTDPNGMLHCFCRTYCETFEFWHLFFFYGKDKNKNACCRSGLLVVCFRVFMFCFGLFLFACLFQNNLGNKPAAYHSHRQIQIMLSGVVCTWRKDSESVIAREWIHSQVFLWRHQLRRGIRSVISTGKSSTFQGAHVATGRKRYHK